MLIGNVFGCVICILLSLSIGIGISVFGIACCVSTYCGIYFTKPYLVIPFFFLIVSFSSEITSHCYIFQILYALGSILGVVYCASHKVFEDTIPSLLILFVFVVYFLSSGWYFYIGYESFVFLKEKQRATKNNLP